MLVSYCGGKKLPVHDKQRLNSKLTSASPFLNNYTEQSLTLCTPPIIKNIFPRNVNMQSRKRTNVIFYIWNFINL